MHLFDLFVANSQRLLHCLLALHKRAYATPNVKAYLESDRRLDFNEHGIFRHYPELDV